MQLLVQEAAKKYNWKNHKNFMLRNVQKIMTHGLKDYNITFYQPDWNIMGKHFALLLQFLIKKLKKGT